MTIQTLHGFPDWLTTDLPKFEALIKSYASASIGNECLESMIEQISSESKVNWTILTPYIIEHFTSSTIALTDLYEYVKKLCTNREFYLFTLHREAIM